MSREGPIINLIKICVGATSISDLEQRQRIQRTNNRMDKKVVHLTRMWPRREKELLRGGSIYWVFKGLILARQEILGLEEVIGADQIKRCGLILHEQIIKTSPKSKRAFQGWRYLTNEQAPPDSGKFSVIDDELPHSLQSELSRLGVR